MLLKGRRRHGLHVHLLCVSVGQVRRAEVHMFGLVFSGLRCVVASSLFLMLWACVLALQLRDLSEVEAEATANSITMTPPMRSTPQMRRLARVSAHAFSSSYCSFSLMPW